MSYLLMFGKNIIITGNFKWTTQEILEASLDCWQVEKIVCGSAMMKNWAAPDP
jgi:hypothetical protein